MRFLKLLLFLTDGFVPFRWVDGEVVLLVPFEAMDECSDWLVELWGSVVSWEDPNGTDGSLEMELVGLSEARESDAWWK